MLSQPLGAAQLCVHPAPYLPSSHAVSQAVPLKPGSHALQDTRLPDDFSNTITAAGSHCDAEVGVPSLSQRSP